VPRHLNRRARQSGRPPKARGERPHRKRCGMYRRNAVSKHAICVTEAQCRPSALMRAISSGRWFGANGISWVSVSRTAGVIRCESQ
jgi:hypothetical protein